MLDLYELKQLTAFSDLGTLSRVAEEFHVSTPSVTWAMQHVEDSFGVPLFFRGKNEIQLNTAGQADVKYSRERLQEAERTVRQVQDFDRRHMAAYPERVEISLTDPETSVAFYLVRRNSGVSTK